MIFIVYSLSILPPFSKWSLISFQSGRSIIIITTLHSLIAENMRAGSNGLSGGFITSNTYLSFAGSSSILNIFILFWLLYYIIMI